MIFNIDKLPRIYDEPGIVIWILCIFCSRIYAEKMRPLTVIVSCYGLFIVCRTLMAQEPGPAFAAEPSGSKNIFEYGETRTLTIEMKCKLSDLQPGQKVSWLKGLDGTIISDNHTVRIQHVSHLIDNGRYSIYGDETHGEYNLQIAMVSYQTAAFDDGRYQCAVYYDDPTILAAVIRSRVVQQIIYVEPRMAYPQCFVNNVSATLVSDAIEGVATTFSCQSDAGHPTVTMTLYHAYPAVILENSVSVHDDVASVEYVWIPNMNDESAIFTCSIDHPAFTFPGGERSRTTCSVGPFNIHRRSTTEYYQHVPEEMFTSMMSVGDNDHNNTNPTLTTMATVTILDEKTNLRLCSGERFSRSIIAGTFIGGLVLGVAMTIISGLLCNYLRHRKGENPGKQESATTATGQAKPIEMDETRGAQYEIIMQNTQDARYQSLTDRSHKDLYTSLQKASQ